MSQPSLQDLQTPFDTTSYTSITGAQLKQLITGAFPGVNNGFVIVTSGTLASPTVPDAVTNTKWQQYIWLHIYTDTNSVGMFVWNPNLSSPLGSTYQNWNPAFSAAIPASSIQGYQIAPNTIVDGNIANLNWSKITNAPTSLPPNGAAGGNLTGTYPNPSLTGITGSMMVVNTVKGGASNQLATGASGVDLTQNVAPTANSNLGSPSGGSVAIAANDRVVLNAAKTGYGTVQKVIDALAEPAAGQALQVIQVNSGGTGFQYAQSNRTLQKIVTNDSNAQASSGNITVGTSALASNATGMTHYAALDTAITVLSASSTLIVRVNIPIGQIGSATVVAGLYRDASTAAIAFTGILQSNGGGYLHLVYKMASPGTGATTFKVYIGASALITAHLNTAIDATTQTFGGLLSSMEIEEYL